MEKTTIGNKILDVKTFVRYYQLEEYYYIQIYGHGLRYLRGLTKMQRDLVDSLIQDMSYSTQYIYLNSSSKEDLCKEHGFKSKSSLKTAFSKLIKANMIRYEATSTYSVNPYVFGYFNADELMKRRIVWDVGSTEDVEATSNETELVDEYSICDETWIKIYPNKLRYLKALTKQQRDILDLIIFKMSDAGDEYGMCVQFTPELRKTLCKECGLTLVSELKNEVVELVNQKILKRIKTNLYQVNPYLFGNGEWLDILQIRVNWAEYLQGTVYDEVLN